MALLRIPMLRPPYRAIAMFVGNLATCLHGGVGLEQSVKTCGRSLQATQFGHVVDGAMQAIRNGATQSDSLDARGARWPPFFLPVLRAGEQSGRVDESLRYLEHHCRMLDGPAQSLQQAWLYPVVVFVAGLVVQFVAHLMLGSARSAFGILFGALVQVAVLGAIAFIALGPLFKHSVDRIRMLVLFVKDFDRELAVNRFFRILSLMVASGGPRVEAMIELAARTVPNLAVRHDLLQAAAEIRRGNPLADAFAACRYLTHDEKASLAVGDVTGMFERACERISDTAGEHLQTRCERFQGVALRLTMWLVVGSVTMTILRLMLRQH